MSRLLKARRRAERARLGLLTPSRPLASPADALAPGQRALGLRWGTLATDDAFHMFGAAKPRLSDLAQELVEQALRDGCLLAAKLGLTDERSHPSCGSVRPPDVVWSTESGEHPNNSFLAPLTACDSRRLPSIS